MNILWILLIIILLGGVGFGGPYYGAYPSSYGFGGAGLLVLILVLLLFFRGSYF